jgi:glutathione S-transferase
MFFEQYSHEPYVAVARFIRGWTPLDSPRRADLPKLRERGHQALAVMEQHLKHIRGSAATLWHRRYRAVRLHRCRRRRRIRLAPYPAIRDWLQRVHRRQGLSRCRRRRWKRLRASPCLTDSFLSCASPMGKWSY